MLFLSSYTDLKIEFQQANDCHKFYTTAQHLFLLIYQNILFPALTFSFFIYLFYFSDASFYILMSNMCDLWLPLSSHVSVVTAH